MWSKERVISQMNVLYVGSLEKYGVANTCLHRYQAMQKIVNNVNKINSFPVNNEKFKKVFCRIFNKLYKYNIKISLPDLGNANKKILEELKKNEYHILWIDKGNTINKNTLIKAKEINPQIIVAGYSPDDMGNIGNQSHNLNKAYPYYDIFFTTKSYNVKELNEKGIKNVVFIGNAYNENFHKPVKLNPEQLKKYKCDIGFIGSYEIDRAKSIKYLAESGLEIRVWGHGWSKISKQKNLIVSPKNIYEEYPAVLSACKINLCFLRKVNRDLQTTRTMEIPATGSFMIAERTSEHLSLFKEDEEAVFFSTDEELLEKCKYYLFNESKRKKIAKNGYNRCLKSGYSNNSRIKQMLIKIEEIQNENQLNLSK